MSLSSRQLRADVREAYGCSCVGDVERKPGRRMSRRLVGLRRSLDAVEATMGHRPPECPWKAFYDPEASEVLRAYDFFESGQLEFYTGPDPSWRLVEGVQHYHRALGIARADVRALSKSDGAKPPPRRPKGAQTVGVVRG